MTKKINKKLKGKSFTDSFSESTKNLEENEVAKEMREHYKKLDKIYNELKKMGVVGLFLLFDDKGTVFRTESANDFRCFIMSMDIEVKSAKGIMLRDLEMARGMNILPIEKPQQAQYIG